MPTTYAGLRHMCHLHRKRIVPLKGVLNTVYGYREAASKIRQNNLKIQKANIILEREGIWPQSKDYFY